jgi:hypothetical protein
VKINALDGAAPRVNYDVFDIVIKGRAYIRIIQFLPQLSHPDFSAFREFYVLMIVTALRSQSQINQTTRFLESRRWINAARAIILYHILAFSVCVHFIILIQHLDGPHFDVRGKVSVPERHLHVGVTHQFPHGVEVCAFHHELRREIVTHVMPSEIFDIRRLDEVLP